MRIICNSCKGTGVYSGMAEKEGCAVMCWTCNGGGYQVAFKFTKLKKRTDIHTVKSSITGIMSYTVFLELYGESDET